MTTYATISNDVPAALRDTLVAHLGDLLEDGVTPRYLPAPLVALTEDQYYMQAGTSDIRASMAPCVCLDEKGATRIEEYVGGSELREYKLDLEIWAVEHGGADGRQLINAWRDALTACIGENWDCGGPVALCETDASDPVFSVGLESNNLWMGVVHVTTSVFVQRGAVRAIGAQDYDDPES